MVPFSMSGCLSPLAFYVKDHIELVRCGRCTYCRIRRKQSWVGRLRLELLDHEHARFVTLTYRDAPEVLPVRDLQLFAKRYRSRFGKCRYFAVGEYGERSGRGHWHVIIFGHAPEAIGRAVGTGLERAWGLGFVYDGTVNEQSIGYVAGYTLKSGDKITRMSLKPGIGLDRLEKLGALAAKSRISSWPGFFSIGRRYPLCDGGLVAFKRGFLNSGGLPPVEESPDDRHFVAVSRLTDWGTRIQGDRDSRFHFMRERGIDNATFVKGPRAREV